ncbi:MAG: hypothetical protein PHS44_05330 [Candidatus Dojkabacteria bacterium]|nr:hypothetical protein [Candidatus Dojkabacteria bacterium]
MALVITVDKIPEVSAQEPRPVCRSSEVDYLWNPGTYSGAGLSIIETRLVGGIKRIFEWSSSLLTTSELDHIVTSGVFHRIFNTVSYPSERDDIDALVAKSALSKVVDQFIELYGKLAQIDFVREAFQGARLVVDGGTGAGVNTYFMRYHAFQDREDVTVCSVDGGFTAVAGGVVMAKAAAARERGDFLVVPIDSGIKHEQLLQEQLVLMGWDFNNFPPESLLGSVDIIVLDHSAVYVQNFQAALANVKQVMRPGGVIIITQANPEVKGILPKMRELGRVLLKLAGRRIQEARDTFRLFGLAKGAGNLLELQQTPDAVREVIQRDPDLINYKEVRYFDKWMLAHVVQVKE